MYILSVKCNTYHRVLATLGMYIFEGCNFPKYASNIRNFMKQLSDACPSGSPSQNHSCFLRTSDTYG